MPFSPSITNKTTSLLSTAAKALMAAYLSMASYDLPFFLKPAVSITTNCCPSLTNAVSIASRVVPSIFETITLSSFKIALVKEDLPTFGLPIQT